jgi:hypothetical protein
VLGARALAMLPQRYRHSGDRKDTLAGHPHPVNDDGTKAGG